MTHDELKARFPNGTAAFLKLNNGLTIPRGTIPVSVAKTLPEPKEPPKKRIRQNSAGLNKTEQAFFEYLATNQDFTAALSQSLTLKIGNGVRYTPDFIVYGYDGNESLFVDAYEVKGFMRDDAAVKLKVAAAQYKWIKFHLVTRKKGEWQIQEVLP